MVHCTHSYLKVHMSKAGLCGARSQSKGVRIPLLYFLKDARISFQNKIASVCLKTCGKLEYFQCGDRLFVPYGEIKKHRTYLEESERNGWQRQEEEWKDARVRDTNINFSQSPQGVMTSTRGCCQLELSLNPCSPIYFSSGLLSAIYLISWSVSLLM